MSSHLLRGSVRRHALAIVTTAALLTGVVASASAAGSPVVRAGGTVAGGSYAYYLERLWQATFAAVATTPPVCATETVHGRPVLFVFGIAAAGTHQINCTVPAGRPVYVGGLSYECSALKGDHGTYGTTASELARCARANLRGAIERFGYDGRRVGNVDALRTSTGVFRFTLNPDNALKSTVHRSRSAAFGYGLLLSGLPRGRHTIVVASGLLSAKFVSTLDVRLQAR